MTNKKSKNSRSKILANKLSGSNLELLGECLREYFAVEDVDFHKFIGKNAEFLELYPGESLINKGDESDEVYFLLSGRLRAFSGHTAQLGEVIGEIGRGEVVGELAMFTQEPRSASIVAIRNSLVARLSRETVESAIKKNPSLAMQITKQIITRFKNQNSKDKAPAPPIIITMAALHENVDLKSFIASLQKAQKKYSNKIAIIDPGNITREYGKLTKPDIKKPRGKLSHYISKLESENDIVLLIADKNDLPWSLTAAHHCDEILLVGDASQQNTVSEFEQLLTNNDTESNNSDINARQTLILLHDEHVKSPTNTSKWLTQRHVSRHFHIRPSLTKDIQRLARILSGNAIGLVLAGGGARGFAHIGVVTALTKMGIDIDFIGGTSAGAIMSSWVAMDVVDDEFVSSARDVFVDSPVGNISGDFNPMPLVSLIKGKRAITVTKNTVLKHAGSEIDFEDAWKTFFAVSSNYSTHKEQILTHGNFAKNIMASFSIPGLLPPTLINGELMYDGGSFNNFPVDIMRKMGAGKIIGVDLMSDHVRKYEMDDAPSSGSIFWDSLKSRKKRQYKLPFLPSTLLTASFITSMARQREMRDQVDLLFQPNIRGIGMLDWKKFDKVVASTHAEALEQLAQLPVKKLKYFQP